MCTFKKTKVILLDTLENKKSNIFKKSIDIEYNKKEPIYGINELGWKYKQLYFIVSEPIKNGDYFYIPSHNSIKKCQDAIALVNSNFLNSDELKGKIFKVIASTDTLLNLPEPSEHFIEKFVESFNNKIHIDTVLIELNENNEIKTKFNQMTIKKVKNTFTKDEVFNLFLEMQHEMAQRIIGNRDTNEKVIPTEWIKNKFNTL